MRSQSPGMAGRVRGRLLRPARASLLALLALMVFAAGLTTSSSSLDAQTRGDGLFPWQIADDGPPGAVGAGFPVTIADLTFILQQIKISEQHSLTYTADEPCSTLIGPGPNQINEGPNAVQLQFGLRTVSGVCNNLVPGQEFFGATEQPFTRLVSTEYRDAEVLSVPFFPPPPLMGDNTTYDPAIQPTGTVEDGDSRTISNLIVDQTNTNPAVVAVAGLAPCSNEVQQLRVDATGGTYTLSFNGQTTIGIAFDAPAAVVEAALETLTNIDDVLVLSGPGGPGGTLPYIIEFQGLQSESDVAEITANVGSLTGTATPSTTLNGIGQPCEGFAAGENYDLPNVATDEGLSASFNSAFIFFGQFFDHGLDLTTKTGDLIYMPLRDDDPLVVGGVTGPSNSFMVLSRAQNDQFEQINLTSPYVDQNQTYTSHPSEQVFIREFAPAPSDPDGAGPKIAGDPFETGRLLNGSASFINPAGGGLATWYDVKAQAADLLGIQLVDFDIHNVPLLATDLYGNYEPGPDRRLPMFVVDDGLGLGGSILIEADPAANGGLGMLVPPLAFRTNHGFAIDIAHHAAPSSPTQPADADVYDRLTGALTPGDGCAATGVPGQTEEPFCDDGMSPPPGGAPGPEGTYDNEMLDAHFICGDPRCNENIALSSVHHVFHSEHNRLVADIEQTLIDDAIATGDNTFLAEWQLAGAGVVGVDCIDDLDAGCEWNGNRIFQAAKFITEMEYQHLAFEEFARKVQPQVNVFAGYDETINAAITAEYSQAAYRFGHSMLNETVPRFDFRTSAGDPLAQDQSLGLIEAFLNPPQFYDGDAVGCTAGGPIFCRGPYTPDAAAGSVIAGLVTQTGQEIDEFVVEALRNNLLGLPLDLPTINLARGRDFGLPPLNQVRREIFAQTGDAIWDPYDSWMDFFFNMQNPESLGNFIAAYGTHPMIRTYDAGGTLVADSMEARRAAVDIMLNQPGHVDYPDDASDFLWSTVTPTFGEDWRPCVAADTRTACTDFAALFPNSDIAGRTSTGVDHIDLWVGGLAERKEIFGGLLGSTHNYIFETQLEKLQDGDRLYYLHRLVGLPLLAALEGNSFSELISRNTTAELLPADVFAIPSFVFDLEVVHESATCSVTAPLVDDPATPYNELDLLFKEPDGTVRYFGEDHILFSGRDLCADRMTADEVDDTVRGKGGDDVLEGGGGNDIVIGGEGDDIITDVFGDDDLKGGPGNDAIHGGQGFDLLQGGEGHDFIVAGSDPTEVLAGPGNDFIKDGDSFGIVFGDPGDDWIEGGGQADLIQGDQGAPFQDNPVMADGHDVLWGQGGNDDYDAEGGDDILVSGPGTERFEGMLGFDWVTAKEEATGVDYDLDRTLLVPPDIDDIADRFDEIEGLSGGPGPDLLVGARRGILPDPGDETRGHHMDFDGQDRIEGLIGVTGIMPDLSTFLNATDCEAAGFTSIGTPFSECVWDDGNIILGGPGSDVIEGKFGDDILDGDRWLNVQIMDGLGGLHNTMSDVTAAVFAGDPNFNPGVLSIVRTIESGDASGSDEAIYGGPVEDYDITNNGDGSFTVDHARGCGDPLGGDACPERPDLEPGIDDGTDTLRNFEIVKFMGNTPAFEVTLADCTVLDGCAPRFSIDDVALDEGDPGDPLDPLDPTETTFSFTVTRTGNLSVAASVDVATADGSLQPATAGVDYTAVAPNTLVFVAGVDTLTVDVIVALDTDIELDETFFVNLSSPSPGTTISDGQGLGTIVDDDAPTDPPGMLRATTSPALPAQISVDGIPRDTWALTWVEMPPGLHEVCYADVQGYSTPACETVNVTSGATSTTVGTYALNGWLRVLTSPALPSTITIGVGGDPLNDWGVWTDVAPGDYNVCYGDVVGFDAPACELVTVVAGATTTATGVFTPNALATGPTGFGMLRVTSSPAVPTQITVDGGANDSWSLQWVKLAPGSHEVCFSDVAGFSTPACQNVTIIDGVTTAVVGTFVERGWLQVNTSPAKASTISVNGVPRNAWGMWTDLEPSTTYEVCFTGVDGFTPACQTGVTVVAGALTTVTGTWLP